EARCDCAATALRIEVRSDPPVDSTTTSSPLGPLVAGGTKRKMRLSANPIRRPPDAHHRRSARSSLHQLWPRGRAHPLAWCLAVSIHFGLRRNGGSGRRKRPSLDAPHVRAVEGVHSRFLQSAFWLRQRGHSCTVGCPCRPAASGGSEAIVS